MQLHSVLAYTRLRSENTHVSHLFLIIVLGNH